MTAAGPVCRALRAALSRKRVQAFVICVVLLGSTGASVVGLALAVDSSAPFDHAFSAQRGADVTATVDPARATAAQLAATGRLPQVSAAAGPFAEATVTLQMGRAGACGQPAPGRLCPGPQPLPPLTLAGRASPGGPVDDITLRSGHWATRPGQLVLASADVYNGDLPPGIGLGTRLTVSGVPGAPLLTIVGIGTSVTGTADGWVVPAEMVGLRPAGAPATAQMLYRFHSAGSATAVRAGLSAVAGALPAGTLSASESYLTARAQEASGAGPIAPFLVAFGVLGLVLAVLTVINVVSGAVVAGYRRIGVLKSIGFTPGQVVAAYTGQAMVPAVLGCLAGLVLGNLVAASLLGQAATAYQVGSLGVPTWVDVTVAVSVVCVTGIAACLPALRAGRLSAVQAISAGQAPRSGRGYVAQRLLGRLPLPRAVTIGLAGPFARPSRTALTLAAVLLGTTAVTFAAGLGGSLSRMLYGQSLARTEQIQIAALPGGAGPGERVVHGKAVSGGPGPAGPSGPQPSAAPQPMDAAAQRTVAAALRTQRGTLHYVAEADEQVSVAGLSGQIPLTAYRGHAAWTGYGMISGRWYAGPDEADVPTYFLSATGKTVGDTVNITFAGRQISLRIAGEVFDPNNSGLDLITDWQTLAGADRGLTASQFDVQLRQGTAPGAYAQALSAALGQRYYVTVNANNKGLPIVLGLIGALALLLAVVAALGTANTVLLQTRERARDLGVLKAVGMTPRQTIAMMLCWVAGTGLVAGVIAVPAGVALQRHLVPVVASAVGTGLPASFLSVYSLGDLVALAAAGMVIAMAGALIPAGWAAASRTAWVLRAE